MCGLKDFDSVSSSATAFTYNGELCGSELSICASVVQI